MPKLALDPPVSRAQQKAMCAAASGHSTLGISRSVGKEFCEAVKAHDSAPRVFSNSGRWYFQYEGASVRGPYPTSEEALRIARAEGNVGAVKGKPFGGKFRFVMDKKRKGARDMSRNDFRDLVGKLNEFFSEEAEEPEHSEDDGFSESDHPRDEGGKFTKGAGILNKVNSPRKIGESGTVFYAKQGSHEQAHKELTGAGFKRETNKNTVQSHKMGRSTAYTSVRVRESSYNHPEGHSVSTKTNQNKHGGGPTTYYNFKFAQDDLSTATNSSIPAMLKRKPAEDAIAEDHWALDEGSVRHKDVDGRLHVARTPISKANVCPYFGREIPNWQQLGLDANKTYRLWRHPDELAKGAETFNNIELLSKHVPVDVNNHPTDLVVGSTGTDAEFQAPYLFNSLVISRADAIADVEKKVKHELSSAYRYRADMVPGTSPEGEPYDGVMRDIIGNHVALVDKGRAGSDVVVGDAAPTNLKRNFTMTAKPLSRKAAVTKGALITFLAPRLAMDASIDLNPILSGITNSNYRSKRESVLERLKTALKNKLAQDANLDGLDTLLMAFDEVAEPEEKKSEDKAKDRKAKDAETAEESEEGKEDEGAEDEEDDEDDRWEKAKDRARDCGMDEKDIESMDAIMRGKDEASEREEMKEKFRERGEGKDKAKDRKAKDKKAHDRAYDGVSKAAMDRALQQTEDRVRTEQRAIRDAERAVQPWTGALDIAFDSAADVYRHALETVCGVDLDGVHPSAYPAMLKLIPTPEQKSRAALRSNNRIAQDSAQGASLLAKFAPDAARIGQSA